MVLPRTWGLQGSYFIPLRLQLLTRMIERELSREMQTSFQMSVAEWRILALTCTEGPISAADVAASYEADPGQISRAVAALIRGGHVKRERLSTDGNRRRITPTPGGREVFDAIHQKRRAYFKTIMRDLSDEDMSALDRMLGQIARRVDEERAAESGQ